MSEPIWISSASEAEPDVDSSDDESGWAAPDLPASRWAFLAPEDNSENESDAEFDDEEAYLKKLFKADQKKLEDWMKKDGEYLPTDKRKRKAPSKKSEGEQEWL